MTAASPAVSLLRVRDAAQQIGISHDTVRRAIKSGELPSVRFGRALRLDPVDLAAWVEARKVRKSA